MHQSTISTLNADLIDAAYQRWQQSPDSVDPQWAAFFEGFEFGRSRVEPAATALASADSGMVATESWLQSRVDGMVYAYRTLGHSKAHLDPLADAAPVQPMLSLAELGFSDGELSRKVSSRFFMGARVMPLREMINQLERIYAGSIGTEFVHIQNPRIRNWVRDRVEARLGNENPARQDRIRRLRTLMQAESFEHFLHTRYVGQKRFSLEGGESLTVVLETILDGCGTHGVEEIVMGMAHRGRLNVLANFLHKSLRAMFSEFSENYVPDLVAGDGDVKYHLGYESSRKTPAGTEVCIRLAANPSHLEAVDPVVQGKARARQRIAGDSLERRRVLPVLLHGDAAFAGQGIVAEVLNMSQLPGYRTGGTIHIIVNNQIGFTTLPADARSTTYATDVAKMIEAPIFHVNGDDPDAVIFVSKLALDFRQEYGRDVVIDMYCYRRHGHNEGDEPLFTQPLLYNTIKDHLSTSQIYKKKLVGEGVLTSTEAEALDDEYNARLESALEEVKRAEAEKGGELDPRFLESNAVFQPRYSHEPTPTGIERETLRRIVTALTTVPESFRIVPKIKKVLLERRAKTFADGGPYDWSFAESIAFGSLLLENTPVRLSGQDSRRGTFSQRHSVLYDEETRERYIPLMNLDPGQARFCVYNSLLSEAAVLGFDYGYSLDFPSMLCIWEAQFGDFSNGAQVIIDQFICSSESKWQRPSGIVMLLPHGYEGQGPEHSSARLERFLQLSAEENIQVCNLTTPAQYFHMLRRQVRRTFLKPLIVMTPKSLLRLPEAVSVEADFLGGSFQEILEAPDNPEPKKTQRVVLCSGKVYYDIMKGVVAEAKRETAVLRVEQLYPLHTERLRELLERYPKSTRIVWCQEEPRNMGAWTHLHEQLEIAAGRKPLYAGRDAAASTAVGSLAIHKMEQRALITEALSA